MTLGMLLAARGRASVRNVADGQRTGLVLRRQMAFPAADLIHVEIDANGLVVGFHRDTFRRILKNIWHHDSPDFLRTAPGWVFCTSLSDVILKPGNRDIISAVHAAALTT